MSSPAKPDPAAKGGAKPDTPETTAVAAPVAASGGIKAWLPVIAALILAPAATWVTVEFLLVPRLQHKLAAPSHGETSASAPAPSSGGHGSASAKGKDAKGTGPSFEFQNVVVNLAGTMGTRYLKTSFTITGADANIKAVFDAAKPKLTDVTLNVLSSLTLSDLEEPGAKNVIREKLVMAYNQALGRKIAEQVYFSDFVVQ